MSGTYYRQIASSAFGVLAMTNLTVFSVIAKHIFPSLRVYLFVIAIIFFRHCNYIFSSLQLYFFVIASVAKQSKSKSSLRLMLSHMSGTHYHQIASSAFGVLAMTNLTVFSDCEAYFFVIASIFPSLRVFFFAIAIIFFRHCNYIFSSLRA